MVEYDRPPERKTTLDPSMVMGWANDALVLLSSGLSFASQALWLILSFV
ncbi:hypothetical protein ACFWPH_32795 [Nocardia sp. NPDC058499]